MRTVDFELQFFSPFVQWLADISWEARTGWHGCRLDDDGWVFCVGPFDHSYRVQRLAIARRSPRVVDDAKRSCDDIRCHVLHKPKRKEKREGETMPARMDMRM